MTLLEIIKYLRTSILDDTGGTGVSWEDLTEDDDESQQLRWSNEELTSFINEAFRKVHRSSYLLKEYNNSSFNISVLVGTSIYNIDSRIIKLLGVRSNNTDKALTRYEIEDIWETDSWTSKSGTPTHYIIDHNTNKITLYPKPTVVDTLNLLYYREELKPLTWTSPQSSPEIEDRYIISALNYATHLAYLKDEANTLDPIKSDRHLALFNADFSNNSSHSEVRRQRTSGRGIRYSDF